ncbi:MAG: hypothetical protein ACFFD1_00110 [Candidatus Thorarchaeota archaeon]
MVDTVTSRVTSNTGKRYEVILSNISDGTGESNVVKVRLSDLKYIGSQNPPSSVAVEKVFYTLSGFPSVTLSWDRDPSPETIVVLPPGQGELCFHPIITDPKSDQTTSTGDILLTTNGSATSGDTYIIKLRLKLKP